MLKAVDDDAGHRVVALLAEGEGALDVVLLNRLEHLRDHLGLALAVFADDEEEALDDHGQADRREQEDGPHDGAAGGEQLHRRFIK